MKQLIKTPLFLPASTVGALGFLVLCACGPADPQADMDNSVPAETRVEEVAHEEEGSVSSASFPPGDLCGSYQTTVTCYSLSATTDRCTNGSTVYKVTRRDLHFYDQGQIVGDVQGVSYNCGPLDWRPCSTACGAID